MLILMTTELSRPDLFELFSRPACLASCFTSFALSFASLALKFLLLRFALSLSIAILFGVLLVCAWFDRVF